MKSWLCGDGKITIVKGDITDQDVDAIVNAANEYLKHGGGVALAIVRRGGDVIQRESDEQIRRRGPLKVGEAVYTSGGNLKARYVIHTVGPRRGDGDEWGKIFEAVSNSLKLAYELGVESIAFPAISAGTFGVDPEVSADAILEATKQFLIKGFGRPREVRIVLYGDEIYNVFLEAASRRLVGCGRASGE